MNIDTPQRCLRHLRDLLLQQEDLNFLLTNRIPRLWVTRAMGRLASLARPR